MDVLPRIWAGTLLLLAVFACGQAASGQRPPAPARTVDVVMLSDPHFDPFHDPSKVAALRESPVSAWNSILSRPASATQVADFNALQTACAVRGADSPWSLVESSLIEAKLREPKPLFVTVGGDLLAHGFLCKLHILAPRASQEELSAFAAKTIAFLSLRIRLTFPDAPIYFALGNNDSGCGDYRETPDSSFLQAVAKSFAEDLRDPANRAALLSGFSQRGDYSVSLSAPMRNARLIVLQDIFESAHFAGCDGQANGAPAAAQIEWLRAQLTAARADGEQVWVMAHVPPGVDVYTTYHRYLFAPGEACNVRQPQMFLSSGALADTLAEFSDIVRFAIFGHTHMDEIKLLTNGSGGAVAAKVVPSISPINGNDPAFIVAQVLPSNAVVKDYEVYAAANARGTGWAREYRFSETYGLPDLSAASAAQLTSGLVADKTGEEETSRAYERYFLAGGGAFAAVGLQRLWPEYSCSLVKNDAEAFHACMCPPEQAKP
jgi:sphingomyelin phosphodiesterase acid-like 3